MSARRTSRLAVLAVAGISAGCSSDGGPTPLGLPAIEEVGALTSLPALPSLPDAPPEILGTPTEVYTRIARGALTCWFPATGGLGLKKDYIYHAEAEPPSKGGRSEIVLFRRDETTTDPRALRAFRVSIATSPDNGKPTVGVENLKMPEPVAARLTADVNRWAASTEGCGDAPVTAGWAAAAPAAPAAKTTKVKSEKK